ncbi:hypothetical protein AVEN_15780-1 [Araneus ventricosus]|uniref:Uncharacterized protein n=1 Tax=Araneus ventricosus TaxID=182803 RepID=A0A4Y2FZV4_ARAVE|nr:hypothetical protein AVEN_15780-1 [Araneus ventricosus]
MREVAGAVLCVCAEFVCLHLILNGYFKDLRLISKSPYAQKTKYNFGRCTSNAKRLRLLQDDENQEEREVRFANKRERMSIVREGVSSFQRSNRLSLNRITFQSQRQNVEAYDA